MYNGLVQQMATHSLFSYTCESSGPMQTASCNLRSIQLFVKQLLFNFVFIAIFGVSQGIVGISWCWQSFRVCYSCEFQLAGCLYL